MFCQTTERQFTLEDFQPFLDQFKIDLWEFGILAWLLAIVDRTFALFSGGFPSAVELIQLFVTTLMAMGWALLSPRSEELALRLTEFFQPVFSDLHSVKSVPSIAQLRKLGYQQTFFWHNWKINHSVIPNPRSQVPVIFVHGFGGSIGHWRQNMSVLAKHHSVYAIDLLGFGASDKPDIDYSIELWVEQLHDFWRTCVDKPVVLVGNSIGSLICSVTARKYPEMVRGIAMISLPDPASQHEIIPAIMRPLVRLIQAIFASSWVLYPLFYLLRHPKIIRRWVMLAYAGREAVTDELLEILAKPAHERDSARAFCAILKAMTHPKFSPNLQSILSNIRAPLLLLWGKQDRMIPIKSAQQFLTYNPHLQLIELEDAGHCAHDECPERVNAELMQWIQAQVLTPDPIKNSRRSLQ
ncbi:alpha/beta fold hydrolase [Leptolyngbya boryana CZ1]|uniref:Alpha/beta fold hydrolase n=1 Tax=Leptolyngbya boryana CZ1 TaxID=3060204 RepID=A0AA97AQN1_LEPBY|nr:alpha/beta fold hydrolase [Leptolyngbya boryana]WNZ43540.1 alpha/beta fold hydrolase [Leptolyngbya boryana CZ1]